MPSSLHTLDPQHNHLSNPISSVHFHHASQKDSVLTGCIALPHHTLGSLFVDAEVLVRRRTAAACSHCQLKPPPPGGDTLVSRERRKPLDDPPGHLRTILLWGFLQAATAAHQFRRFDPVRHEAASLATWQPSIVKGKPTVFADLDGAFIGIGYGR